MTKAWQNKKATRSLSSWTMTHAELTALGKRWVAGESIQALAREAKVAVTTLYGRMTRAGFILPPEEIFLRSARGGRTAQPLGADKSSFRPIPENDPLLAKLWEAHPEGARAWTESRDQLAALWNEGLTQSEIAKRMGITRSAVAAAGRRQGLPKRKPGRPKGSRDGAGRADA